ncbi:MAG: serine/threonine-protein kinase [Haloechinothrix sp.]
MSDEGRLVAGRYRITRRIGTGAMGAVWHAQDELLQRPVAIKQLLLQPGLDEDDAEEARQRTMREGRLAARLHHPNAITVFDVSTDEHSQPCLIMEYLESTSLAEVLRGGTTLPPIDVARIGAQIAAALKSAHRVGIVHRDIKPGNILLTSDGVVKITDFGISRANDDVTVTKTGMIAGTPAYLAPEVAIGQNPGPESDVFSLGSTLYAATEGQPPFGLSENTLSLLHSVAAGQINPPRQSGPLTSVLALLLHPDKAHRPTAAETEELLDAVARGETPIGAPDADSATTARLGAAGPGAAGPGAAGTPDGDPGATVLAGHSGTLTGLPAADGTGPDAPTALYAGAVHADGTRTAMDAADYDYDDGPPRGRWQRLVAVGGLVLVALAAFGLWMFTGSGEQNNPNTNPAPPPTSAPASSEEPTTTPEEPERTTQAPQPAPEPRPQPQPQVTTTEPPAEQTTEPTELTTPSEENSPPPDEDSGGDGPPPGDDTSSSPPSTPSSPTSAG